MKGQSAVTHSLKYLLSTCYMPDKSQEKTHPKKARLLGKQIDFYVPADQPQSEALLLQ